MKQGNNIAYLRQLCNLGLGREIVIPEFLKAVQAVIPSGNNFFTGTNRQGLPSYVLTELFVPNLQDVGADVMPRFFTPEKMAAICDYCSRYSAITDHRILDRQFFQTEFYHHLWQPWSLYHFILAPIMVNRMMAGLFFLFRPHDVEPFTEEEEELCLQLLPYIAHALQEPKIKETKYVNSGQSSMIIADRDGGIAHLSASSRRLLSLVSGQDANERSRVKKPVLPEAVVNLCRRLDGATGEEGFGPTIMTHTNAVGRFVFRVYPLDRADNGPNAFIGITIDHQEPLPLKIARNLQFLPLSVTEKEATLLWVQGHSYESVAQQLHIRSTTARSHIRNIYVKLKIKSRAQLRAKLMPEKEIGGIF